jgi:hypothetical protein
MATYSDLAGFRNSSAFTDRCTLAIASYAKYILGQTNVPARKYAWAQNTFLNPNGVFQQLSNGIVLDPTFTGLANGTADISSITDAQVDSAVQTTINNSGLF